MRTPFDRLAKDLFSALLAPACRAVIPEREISGDAQRLDLWCDPDPDRLSELGPTLLRRMLEDGPCAFEFFHQPPTLEQVQRALRKGLALRHAAAPAAILWIIAAGRPERVFADLPSLQPASGWPTGIYALDAGLGLRLIISSELPRTADTLLFRLVGARRTLRDALLELQRLPGNDALSRVARPMVVRLLGDARESASSALEQELAMNEQELQELQQAYDKWERDLLQRGEAQGRVEGEARGRAEGEAQAIMTVLQARGIPVPPEAAARIQSTTDLDTLKLWLTRAITAASVDEIFEPPVASA